MKNLVINTTILFSSFLFIGFTLPSNEMANAKDSVENNEYAPATPPSPSISNNCGYAIIVRMDPPSGVTYYWQSTSTGTSTANSSKVLQQTTGSPYGTVYYIRARDNSTGQWSSARSFTYYINIQPGLSVPSTPTVSGGCGSVTITRTTPPTGVTWYWQSSPNLTDTSNSSASIIKTSGAVQFLRARNNSSGCWSDGAAQVNFTVNSNPDTPSIPTIDATCGATNIFAGTPPTGVTWFWQTSAAGTSTVSVASSSSPKTITAGNPSGTIYLRARNNSTGCWSENSRTVSYTVREIPGIPTVPSVSNNCGNSVLTRTNPPTGVTWYWQSSSSGTDTSNSSASITRTSGSTYYLRARHNSSACWSNAVTVNYSIQSIPSAPTVPTVTNNCGNSVLTRSNPPTGVTWYWQSTASGTSTSNSSASITQTSGSVYYLRARNNSTGCWSPEVSVNYSIKSVPDMPDAATIAINCGSTVLTRNNPPTGITWYWQSSPSGTSTSQSSVSITRTSGGVYYLRARNNSSLCWSEARAVGYTIKNAPDAPPTPNVDNNCENTVLSHNGSAPPNTTWYWQSTGGGMSTENSSTSISLTSGSLYFIRARNDDNGCWSPPTSVSYTLPSPPDIPPAPEHHTSCGATTMVTETPPVGIKYYWQTTSNGTSTSDNTTVKTITAGNPSGTLYLKALNESTGCWSGSRTVNYTVKIVPSTPTTPTVINHCGNTELKFNGSPPTNTVWLWQSSADGTSTSNSSSSIVLTSGNVYYLRAMSSNGSGCWSNAVTVNYDIQSIPGVPTINNITKNCGNTVLRRNNPTDNNILWYWQSSPTGTSTSDSNITITRTTGNIYYLRAKNSITNCWSEATQINYTINIEPEMPPEINVIYECDGTTLLNRSSNPPPGETWYWQSSSDGTTTTDAGPSFARLTGGYYYLRPRNNTTLCWGPARIVGYGIYPATEKPVSPIVENNCGSTTLRHNGLAPEGLTWYWQSTPYGTSFDNPDDSITLTSGNTYYIRAYNNANCWSDARYIDYYIDQAPLWYADTDNDTYGDPNVSISQCDQPAGYVPNNYDYDDTNNLITDILPITWYYDSDGDGFGTSDSTKYQSNKPGGYVDNNLDQCPAQSGSDNGCPSPTDQRLVLSNENYVFTRSYQKPLPSSDSITSDADVIEAVTYFDGLSRAKQSIAIKAGGQHQDIITPVQYDEFSRQVKDYLPYAATSKHGEIFTDPMGDVSGFYSSKYGATPNPYSEKGMEASPLNRIFEQGAPGSTWAVIPNDDTDHTIKFDYLYNGFQEVRLFEVDFISGNTENPQLALNGYYTENNLYKTITKDENWALAKGKNHTTEEFKDKLGRVVLKRTYNYTPPETEVEGQHDTYYVYDRFGNLTYVIPPGVNTTDGVSATELSELCYQYRYDDRNRLVEKKIPGKGWEYIVYNILDQPVMTQDANLRDDGQWLFTKYDAFGRVVYTGTFPSGASRADRQTSQDASGAYETKTGSSITVDNRSLYYTNGVLPTTNLSLHTINYYDNYIFDLAGLTVPAESIYNQTITTNVKGLPTGSKVRVLGTNNWITTLMLYDEKGRAIYVAAKNEYLGTTDIVETLYDFPGKVIESKTIHIKGSNTPIVTIDAFTYDHAGRLLTQTQSINGAVPELIAENYYDELGQLKNKGVGNVATSTSRLQTIDYTYNIRGWLTQINDINNLGTHLFSFKVNYNTTELGGGNAPLYNGNISETIWKTASIDPGTLEQGINRGYAYEYDALNRIEGAQFTKHNGSTYQFAGGYNLWGLTYDKNGNIKYLKRSGGSGQFDDLDYLYDSGNKLLSVTDAHTSTEGFNDGNKTGYDYGYDLNGNMTKDLNKGIGTASLNGIAYNHLNLPTEVKFNNSNTQKINYIYSAGGAKLQKIVNENGNVTITDYAGNYIYENSSLKFFNHAEGYAEPINPNNYSDGFNYIYQYKDHLGNVRLSYKNIGTTGSLNLEILEENNYYPFGLKHKGYNNNTSANANSVAQKFKYNGKELNEELGLNWYDYGARNYDASLGRWMNIDPLLQFHSPYIYAGNDPIRYMDPTGMYSTEEWKRDNGVTDDDLISVYQSDDSDDGENDCCGEGNIFTSLLNSLNSFISSIGSDDGPDEESLQNIENITSGMREGARNVNEVMEKFDVIGASSPARLAAALSNGEMTVDEYYDSINKYLATNNTIVGDVIFTALFIVPGGGQGGSTIKGSSKILLNSTKQLQRKFKHAEHFGISGTETKSNLAKFSSAINQHINNPAIRVIHGTYQGKPVTHYVNPNTGLNVFSKPDGTFISGWKLSAEQLKNVLTRGSL